MLSADRHGKCKYMAARPGADLFPVAVKRDGFLIGINFNLCFGLRPVRKALPADMDERIRVVPPGLIEIKAVLFDLAVKSHKALVVHAGLAALVAGVCREVEHVPHVGGPHEGALRKALQQVFVIKSLILFRLVAAAGLCAVQGRHRLRAVLGVAQAPVGIDFVEEVDPQVV